MLFFKKRKKQKKEEYQYLNPELDVGEEFRRRREKQRDNKEFQDIEDVQYIRSHCEQMMESFKYVDELKQEYKTVQSYLTDIQIIASQPDEIQRYLKSLSVEIESLDAKRREYSSKPKSLSASKIARYTTYEEEFPEALTNLQNDEKYCQAVKHDIKVLQAEKVSLKEDISRYRDRRINIRNISVISLMGIVAVFIIFFISGQLNMDKGRALFMFVLLLAAIFVMLIFFLQKNAVFEIKSSEKKLAKTITLLNKMKIKYVNIVNSIDYQCAKYDVKNSYQLGREYEAFLEDKKNLDKYHDSVKELDNTVATLNKVLSGLNLYDASVWESQSIAFSNEDEMIEIRTRLNTRRQKLREQIDYNMERIDAAKKCILDFVREHPDKSAEVMGIVDSYDMEV